MNNTAEMTLTEFKSECPEAYAACRQTAFEVLVCNPAVYWKAVSSRGVKFSGTREQVKAVKALQAQKMIHASISGDLCHLGRLLDAQLREYLEEDVEAWVQDNWREWA